MESIYTFDKGARTDVFPSKILMDEASRLELVGLIIGRDGCEVET